MTMLRTGATMLMLALIAGCAQPAHVSPAPPVAAPPSAGFVPPGMQFLYGSGEAAALGVQAWRVLAGFAATARTGVVLASGATLAAPRFTDCGGRPRAIVLDLDETGLLNLGFEYDEATRAGAYDESRWQAWERSGADRVLPVPGAAEALAEVRAAGLTVVFNTNRSRATAAGTVRAIAAAGLGSAVPGETLWLRGDLDAGSGKDSRRAAIAARYCVVAMAGDQLGDFSDLFNARLSVTERRAAASAPQIARLWGRGWFVLPNPVYGTALKGSIDEVFPADRRWHPGAAGASKEDVN